MKERIQDVRNSFIHISGTIRERVGVEIEPEIIKAEMRRVRRDVQKHIHSGNWDIKEVSSAVFKGVFPLIVFAGGVYVARKICTNHEVVFDDNPDIPRLRAPIGGFVWPFNTEIIGEGGVYEPDEELVDDKFPAEQILEDRQALTDFLEENGLIEIKKAEYLR